MYISFPDLKHDKTKLLDKFYASAPAIDKFRKKKNIVKFDPCRIPKPRQKRIDKEEKIMIRRLFPDKKQERK